MRTSSLLGVLNLEAGGAVGSLWAEGPQYPQGPDLALLPALELLPLEA